MTWLMFILFDPAVIIATAAVCAAGFLAVALLWPLTDPGAREAPPLPSHVRVIPPATRPFDWSRDCPEVAGP